MPLLCSLGFAVAGCNNAPPAGYEVDPTVETADQTIVVHRHRKVDILLVIDDSGSMADSAASMAQALHEMGEVVTRSDARLNVRIGVTTTSSVHPRCDGGFDGQLVSSACPQRSASFVSTGDEGEKGDWYEEGCLSFCSPEAAERLIDGFEPTTTTTDATPRRRPWIEYNVVENNLPPGLEVADALACIGPQGVSGCEFEQPLEATYKAIERMLDGEAPEYGFLRDDASLLVVVLTDEDDCSRTDTQHFIVPNANSATCWNAAATCESSQDGLLCEANDGPHLEPISRYVDLLSQIDSQKRDRDPDARVLMTVVGGFAAGQGWPQGFANASQPADLPFGRASGCTLDNVRAYPGVRLPEVANALNPDGLYSICTQSEFGLSPILGWPPQIRPACFEACPLDTDPNTEVLEPDCVVEQTIGADTHQLSPCLYNGEQHLPPDGEASCYVALTDDGSAGPHSLSLECIDQGHQLEFRIIRTEPVVEDVSIVATCAVSPQPDIDCG